MTEENKNSIDEPRDEDIVNPGDCFGFYLESDLSCQLCEIADLCKKATEEDGDECL